MTSKQNTVRKTLKIYQNTQTVRLTTLVFFFKKDVVMALAQVRFISLVYDCMNTFYFSFFFFCFFFDEVSNFCNRILPIRDWI